MRSGLIRVLAIVALLVLPATAFAQFGHPFNGAYSGGWGKDQSNRLLFNTLWDGNKVTGTITSAGATLNVTSVDFDYSNPEAWKVTLKADGKDATTRRQLDFPYDGNPRTMRTFIVERGAVAPAPPAPVPTPAAPAQRPPAR